MKLAIFLPLAAAIMLSACAGDSNTKPSDDTASNAGKRYTQATVAQDVILTDSKTKLNWTNSENGCNPLMGISNAEAEQTARHFCDGLVFAGHSDWRLPTVAEMTDLEVETDKAGLSLYYKNPSCRRVLAVEGSKLTAISTTNMSPVGRNVGMELPAGTRCVR